jgi:threonine/homoserine/homoserine lactone efflux protein
MLHPGEYLAPIVELREVVDRVVNANNGVETPWDRKFPHILPQKRNLRQALPGNCEHSRREIQTEDLEIISKILEHCSCPTGKFEQRCGRGIPFLDERFQENSLLLRIAHDSVVMFAELVVIRHDGVCHLSTSCTLVRPPIICRIALTPGPGIMYVLGRSLHGGRREGVLSSLGTFVGGSVHVLAAGLGLSAILMTSATAFQVVRYTGAAYLVYLGISMIRKRRASENMQTVGQSSQQNFLQGIATEVLNPKTALFFLSFIPQFVSPAKGHLILQFLILGTISVVLNTTVDFVVVGFAGLIAQRLARNPKLIERQRTGSGVGMIGLGVYVAVSK